LRVITVRGLWLSALGLWKSRSLASQNAKD
jgi:hypothetical protein